MSKRIRRPSAKQTDKYNIRAAKILKSKGVISKQTKLHGGRFVSAAVAKKVQELRHLAFNQMGEDKPQYVALKVPKEFAKRAKEEGYQVLQGNKVVIPKEHDFIARVKREAKLGRAGLPSHVSGITPVKGGFKSEITIPFTPENTHDLMQWLENGDLEERKLEHEMFMFTFHGSTSRRAFNSAAQMRKYLEHYNQDETFKAIKIFRLHPDDQIKFIDEERVSVKRGPRGGQERRDTRSAQRARSYAQRMDYYKRQVPVAYEREKRLQAERQKAKTERLKRDPKKYKASLERGRKRAREWYAKHKGGGK